MVLITLLTEFLLISVAWGFNDVGLNSSALLNPKIFNVFLQTSPLKCHFQTISKVNKLAILIKMPWNCRDVIHFSGLTLTGSQFL